MLVALFCYKMCVNGATAAMKILCCQDDHDCASQRYDIPLQAREFRLVGPAHACDLLPEWRRSQIDPERNSQLYMKRIEAPAPGMSPPGGRIGW